MDGRRRVNKWVNSLYYCKSCKHFLQVSQTMVVNAISSLVRFCRVCNKAMICLQVSNLRRIIAQSAKSQPFLEFLKERTNYISHENNTTIIHSFMKLHRDAYKLLQATINSFFISLSYNNRTPSQSISS